jgi:hypothetical protein
MPRTDTVPGLTVADLARRFRVSPDKVRAFLRRGELTAVNLATNLSGRPLWRITHQSVERFERRRSSTPPAKPARRRRAPVHDYYPDSPETDGVQGEAARG